MASSIDYLNYILEQLNDLDGLSYKKMMGEYLLYIDGTLTGGIYDDRLLVKITNNNKKYNMQEAIPYTSAKPMYLVDEVDNKEVLKNILMDTYYSLINKNN